MATAVVFKYHWKTCQNRWKMAKFQKVGHIWKMRHQASLKNSNFAILGQFQGDFVVVKTKKMTDFLFFADRLSEIWPILADFMANSFRNSIFLVEFSGNVGRNIFLKSTARQNFFGQISRNRDWNAIFCASFTIGVPILDIWGLILWFSYSFWQLGLGGPEKLTRNDQ